MQRHTRDTIVAEINKIIKGQRGKVNQAHVMLMWQRLMVGDPDIWIPLFEKWCGRRGSAEAEPEQEPVSAYDREGK